MSDVCDFNGGNDALLTFWMGRFNSGDRRDHPWSGTVIEGSAMTWEDVPLGITRERLVELLGSPDAVGGTSRRYKTPIIYKYGEIEYCFHHRKEGLLATVFDNANHVTLK